MNETVTVFAAMQNQGCTEGQLAVSRAGHDQGRIYLIIQIDQNFALCADGDYRTYEHPKRKRISHLRLLGSLEAQAFEMILQPQESGQRNALIRTLISTHPGWSEATNPVTGGTHV